MILWRNTFFNSADAATGSFSLYSKVVIVNNTEESLTTSPFVLAVDALDNDETGITDMEDLDCGCSPSDLADQIDRDLNQLLHVHNLITLQMTLIA